ncbi:autophagy-related protein 3 [Monosporozyma unispora]|nr:E2-like enzyme [Kazachstania unispora]
MLRSTISNWREYLTPISHKSTFFSTGQITPEEFLQAGDYLTHMFPTWKWNGIEDLDNVSVRDFLPAEKQFLISRKVPCQVRADDFFNVQDAFDDNFDEEHLESLKSDNSNLKQENNSTPSNDKSSKVSEVDDIDDLIDSMEIKESGSDDDDNELIQDDDDDEVIMKSDPNKRYYDLYITYSTSYRVPKMYIVGFNAAGTPLSAKEMFDDITTEYRAKTATIEKLPFYKSSMISVSIHPCKHANVMKILLEKVRLVKKRRREELKQQQIEFSSTSAGDNNDNDNEWEDLQDDVTDTLQVDQYLVVFLKFITSITPSIEHDYTMEGW